MGELQQIVFLIRVLPGKMLHLAHFFEKVPEV